jgi:plasmid maintenance system antidote protein VapI
MSLWHIYHQSKIKADALAEIIAGCREVTEFDANELAYCFRTTPAFWTTLQHIYQDQSKIF